MNANLYALPMTRSKSDITRLLMVFALFAVLMLMWQHAFASDGAEFQGAADQFQTWVKGNLGKLAAFVSVAVGSVLAATRKDWSWFMGAIVLAVGIGIMSTVINASFTAII
jgi:conjugal transfer pilus assembly protein TraA